MSFIILQLFDIRRTAVDSPTRHNRTQFSVAVVSTKPEMCIRKNRIEFEVLRQ
jgi:hypothetical protein